MSGVATLKLRGSKRHFDEMAVDLPVSPHPQACSPGRYPLRPPPLKRGRCIVPSPISTPLRQHNPNTKHLFQQFSNSLASSSSSSPSPSTSTLKDRILIINNNITTNNNNSHNNSTNNSNTSNINSKQQASSSACTCTSPQQQQQQQNSSPPQQKQQAPQQQSQQHQQQQQVEKSKQNDNNNINVTNKSIVVSQEDLNALTRHLPRRLKRVIDRLATGQVYNQEKLFTLSDLHEIVNSVLNEREAKLREQFTTTLNERLNEQFRDFTKFNEDYVSRQLRGTDVAYLS